MPQNFPRGASERGKDDYLNIAAGKSNSVRLEGTVPVLKTQIRMPRTFSGFFADSGFISTALSYMRYARSSSLCCELICRRFHRFQAMQYRLDP